MRYFLHLSYKGTAYKGWQRQNNATPCVQEVLESTLHKMTNKKMSLMGCGRTDAGVHAMQYFAHFDYEAEWHYDPVERLNRMLPHDISVFELIPVHERAHSRYDAIQRSYEYHLHLEPNAYLSPISLWFDGPKLDFEAINAGLATIHQTRDFGHLCLTPDKFNNTLCNIYSSKLKISEDGKQICFMFSANRFLKSMIRMIVARLMALGEGRINIEEFADSKSNNQMLKFRTMAGPQGLHLSKIVYPYLERDVQPAFLMR
ncbi:MAG: tRNA pseudouridine synthase A [Saprospiraceae bacterium]|nr:tRNA pseudouridine synthase A [Saprospiraceae bacterium]